MTHSGPSVALVAFLGFFLSSLISSACGPRAMPPEPARHQAEPAPPPKEENAVAEKGPTITPAARAAIADLAQRLGVGASDVALVRVEEVDWPDASAGCPQPGMNYAQVITNGTFIQLKSGDRLYNYHGGGSRSPSLCTSKDEVLPESVRKPPGR